MSQTFGQRAKAAREQSGLSLTRIAPAAGISKSYLHEMESGKTKSPNLYVAFRLASALGVPLIELAFDLQKPNADRRESVVPPSFHNEALENVELKRRLARIERIARGETP